MHKGLLRLSGSSWRRGLLLPCLAASSLQAAPDVTHYRLELGVNPASLNLTGLATLNVTAATGGGAVTAVPLDLVGLTVSAVTWNGLPVSFTRTGPTLELPLPSPLAEGSSGTLTIAYSGIPEPYVTEQGSLGIMQDKNTTFAINVTEGARHWFPSRDRLDDKASVDLLLTLPRGNTSAGPGHLEGITANSNGTETHHWSMSQDVTPYLLSFAFSDRYVRTQLPVSLQGGEKILDIVLQPETWATAGPAVEILPGMLSWLEDRYGPFPYDQVGMHEIPFGGCVEQPGNIAVGTLYWSGLSTMEPYLAHELSHTWFQGQVTIRSWNDIFMSESVAAFHELLWTEERDGIEAADQLAQLYLASYLSSIPDEGSFPLSSPEVLFGYTVYVKGPLLLRMLEHWMGREALKGVLRQYLTGAGGVSDLDTFLDLLEATGLPSVQPFRSQWIERGGLPDYRFGWKTGPSGSGYGLALSLQQPSVLYTTPIDVEIQFADGSTQTETLQPDGPDSLKTLCVSTEPVAVTLDPRYLVPRGQTGTVQFTGAVDGICEEPQGCSAMRSLDRLPPRHPATGVLLLPLALLGLRHRRRR